MNSQNILSLLITQSKPCITELKTKLNTHSKKQQNFENIKNFVSTLNINDFQSKIATQEKILEKEELYGILSTLLIVLKEQYDFLAQKLPGNLNLI
jgi:hypothetical protein